MPPFPVTLFIPCLIDQVYPEMGLAAARLLRRLGYEVHCPTQLACCGQPAFNSGEVRAARSVAEVCLSELSRSADAIVCPSGSCTAMMRNYYTELFPGDARCGALSAKIFEFGEFLKREGALARIQGQAPGRIGFHNSCHSLRELGLASYADILRAAVPNCEIVEPKSFAGAEPVCCGFGGTFCFKFPKIAEGMALTRLEMFLNEKVDAVVSNDPGCIMHLRKECALRGEKLPILHVAEFLAESAGVPLEEARA